MERRGHCHGGKPPHPHPPPRRVRTRQPSSGSFSASLLDAIYRSLDDGDGADVVIDAARGSVEEKAAATATAQFWWLNKAAAPKPCRQSSSTADRDRRRREAGVARPRHSGSGYASSTASSSDSSAASYSSLSCSSASTVGIESTCRRHGLPPPRVSLSEESVATDAEETTPPPPNSKPKKKARPCFPVARIRPRASVPPPSSGPQPPSSPATFACALKALFSSARLQRKPKAPAPARTTPPPKISQPPRMSTTSAAKAADAPQPSEPTTVRLHPEAEASVVRRRVEELVRGLEELEEDEERSDASSDLFELESLRGAGADELPVYGTTSLVANRAIAQGPGGQLVNK
ncbi:hypothetical protein Zm00014a_043376 [Zea mays]|uniref:Uncharacterized protein n=1 Tax=Zea mays TaxID=4577 RepID=A0A3L6E1P9_MAIZE|nr:hypothetical protein Zm00014a_043376 [Zea mays]